jgi:uncharacterized protein GlcG (DUF336 family)
MVALKQLNDAKPVTKLGEVTMKREIFDLRRLKIIAASLFLIANAAYAEADIANINAVASRVAEAAVAACSEKGYRVTATVVNSEGLLVGVLRADGATPHTLDSSKQKAYTAASFAPIVNLDKTSEIAERLLANQTSAQLAHLPNILLVGGGMAIRSGGRVIGGIGVGGAPGGHLDEECAAAGIAKISQK